METNQKQITTKECYYILARHVVWEVFWFFEKREMSAGEVIKTHHLQSETFSLMRAERPKEKDVIPCHWIPVPFFFLVRTLYGWS